MSELARGTRVRVIPGSEVLLWDGMSHHPEDSVIAGYRLFERTIWEADCADCELIVRTAGPSHATMNGGGRDYELECPHTGYVVQIRTTFRRPESAWMVVA